jgi:hypothetical protein
MQESPLKVKVINATMSADNNSYFFSSSADSTYHYNFRNGIDVLTGTIPSSKMDKESPSEEPLSLMTRIWKQPYTPQSKKSVSLKKLTSLQKKTSNIIGFFKQANNKRR